MLVCTFTVATKPRHCIADVCSCGQDFAVKSETGDGKDCSGLLYLTLCTRAG